MEHIAALLLIIGCSNGVSDCRELPSPNPVFEVREDCDSALPESLGAFTGQFDQVYAQCISVDPALEEEDAELVWDVLPDGTLTASIESSDVMLASDAPSAQEYVNRQ